MSNDEEQLFSQLASDQDIAAAVAEHEAACAMKQELPCPICLFFNHIHELRHLSEALDPEKIVNLAASTPDFLDDAMVIVGFLTEATRYFLADQIAWSEMDEEENDEEEDEDE